MKTAMILAAGRGERLRPITDSIPKALCKVHGIPLIEYHVVNLARAGFTKLVINHAYLGGQIRHYLGDGKRWGIEICYAPEPPGGLETGGGIFNALPLLGNQPFLTVNADIFTDYDFIIPTLPTDSQVHLILVKKPGYCPHGDFGLSRTGFLKNNDNHYTFSGIAYYQPSLFHGMQPGRYSITPRLRELVALNQATGELYTGQWFDIGDSERLRLASNAIAPKTLS